MVVSELPDPKSTVPGPVKTLLIGPSAPMLDAFKMALDQAGIPGEVYLDPVLADMQARTGTYDLILLDLSLPNGEAWRLLKEWRGLNLTCHIFGLDGTDQPNDRVKALNLGADDVLLRTCEQLELMARIRALFRRKAPTVSNNILRCHDLEIDQVTRKVARGGKEIHLTRLEYKLLLYLALHKGRVLSRTLIWSHLYNEFGDRTSNVVDVYIRYLRSKVDAGFDLPLIITRRGEGYALRGEED